MQRNTMIRLGVYPVVVLLAGGMLWLWLGARRAARAEALTKQAHAEAGLGLWDSAEQSARAATGEDPRNYAAWAVLGEILGRTARHDGAGNGDRRAEAAQALERAQALSGTEVTRLLEVADAATKAGCFDVAESAATAAVARAPSPGALWLRGRARWLAASEGDRAPARADFDAAFAAASKPEVPAQIGAFAMLFDDAALTAAAAARLREVAPEEPEGPAMEGWLAERDGNAAAALAHYDAALGLAQQRERQRPAGTLSATEARRRFLAELHFRRGGLRYAADPKSAAGDLDAAFELNPASPVVAHLAAQARLAAGRPDDAAAALAQAWRRSEHRPALRAEIVAQWNAGTWNALPASPVRDAVAAAAAAAGDGGK